MFLEDIGKRMNGIRMMKGIKQKDLAKELEIHPSLLSSYEKGKREPSISTLKKFANYFSMTLSQFFFQIEYTEANPDNFIFHNIINSLNNVRSSFEKEIIQKE